MKSRLHHSPKNDRTKCVRLKSGEIVRVPNDEAHEIVTVNRGRYVPKKEWKAQLAEQKKKKAA